jgi:hypothetical protein
MSLTPKHSLKSNHVHLNLNTISGPLRAFVIRVNNIIIVTLGCIGIVPEAYLHLRRRRSRGEDVGTQQLAIRDLIPPFTSVILRINIISRTGMSSVEQTLELQQWTRQFCGDRRKAKSPKKITLSLIVIRISKPRNHSLTYRKKNCRRGRLRPSQDNLEGVERFRGQGVHNIFCATENI